MTPAFSTFNLLICKYSITVRTPVYIRFFLVNKPFFIHLNKKLLIPLIVFWSISAKFPVPVIRKPHKLHLPSHIVNVRFSPFPRMCPIVNCGIFRRQPKTVPSKRMQHIKPLHLLVSCNRISNRIISQMPNMKFSRWIRKHLKHIIILFSLNLIFRFKNILFKPFILPLFLNFRRFVFLCHCFPPFFQYLVLQFYF